MNPFKTLKLISFVENHPNIMSTKEIEEWYNNLRTLEGVRIIDPDGASHLRCKHGVLQSKFSVCFGDVVKTDVVLTKVNPESKKYTVSSVTRYFNGFKSQHGVKEYNTWQKEVFQ